MAESCVKPQLPRPRIPNIRVFQPTTRIPTFTYEQFNESVEILPSRPECLYRRNDPTNRSYRMKKRPPAQIYHCVQCNKHIKYPSKITEHIRKHTGEKPNVCSICNISFSQAHTLKTHMQQHAHEKPYKCSFCTAEFLNVYEKNEHEEQHMHHPNHGETMEENNATTSQFIQVAEPTIQAEPCQIYECSEMCGFQSYEEAEVVEHMTVTHYQQTVQNGLILQDFNGEPEPIYEFYEEQYVQQVPTEIEETPTIKQQSIPYENLHFEHVEAAPGPSEPHLQVVAEGEILYDGEEIVDISNGKSLKEEIQNGDANIYGMIQDLEEEVEDIGNEDEERERVRIMVNPNPPKRGTKSLRDHHEATAATMEMIVDASILELAEPSRHLKQGYPPISKRKNTGKRAENLDWIIDAVAKGVDVSEASPHHRKKPTLHKCEYCGRVDKYPSKIRAHMRTHTGEKPFKCEICGMAFSQKTPMRLHLRRHFDQKPYECDVDGCKERFVSGAILKMHVEKKHLNKKKYVCSRGCGRVFSSAYNQKHHEKKCEQTYVTWVEGEQQSVESGEEDEESNGEYPDDDEEYMDDMIDASTSQPINRVVEHFSEEPVFLHQ